MIRSPNFSTVWAFTPPIFTYISIAVLLALITAASIPSTLAPHDPYEISYDGSESHAPPGGDYRLGADALGRDILSRLIYAARPVVLTVLAAVGLAAAAAVVVRLAPPPHVLDNIRRLTRGVDIVLGALLLLFVLAVLMEKQYGIGCAVGATTAPHFVRRDYGLAHSAGYLCYLAAAAVCLDACLRFLDLGVQPPTPYWGVLTMDALNALAQGDHGTLWPLWSIIITAAAFFSLGWSLRHK